MKQGKTITDMARELDRHAQQKRDYLVTSNQIRLCGELNSLEFGGHLSQGITAHCHRQIGEKVGIPAKYYDLMRNEAPQLLERNVNHWLGSSNDRRMVRMLNSTARAFLSDRYRPLDNYDLMETVLPVIIDSGADVVSCNVDENRLYIKAVVPERSAEIAPAGKEDFTWGKDHLPIDVVNPGIVIGNSEVGLSSLYISPAIHTVRCSNLAVFKADAMRKYHIGQKFDEDVFEVFSDKTKEVSEAAVWLQVRDLVNASFNGTVFDKLVERLRVARGAEITKDPVEVVQLVAKNNALSESESKGVLAHLIRGGELSQYALSAAVTRFSQEDDVTYDRASELEGVGASIIELAPKQWHTLAQAA